MGTACLLSVSIFASLVIAGAVAFCADAPSDELCSARELAPVEITFADRAALVALAERLADGYMRPDRGGGSARQPRDDWRIDPRGDCEDRVMWALHELKRTHPNLWRAAEPAMFVFETERASARQRAHGQAELVRFAHVVLIVRTTGGDILIDPEREGRIVAVSNYMRRRLYAPRGGINAHWIRTQTH